MLTPHNATILIVDDSPENLMVLTELLSPHYRVLAAQSGEKCLRIVSADPKPDLILLDVMMPGMDGYEVLRQLRQSPISSRIPVVLLTALADPQSEEFGLSLGAAATSPSPSSRWSFRPGCVPSWRPNRPVTACKTRMRRWKPRSRGEWRKTT